MQTFLPFPDFEESFRALDYRRLGKQRSEAYEIVRILEGKPSRWRNHPAVKMWRGYTEALKLYTNLCIKEWIRRGYKNNMILFDIDYKKVVYPHWLGKESFHISHQSNLLRKKPEYYFDKFETTDPTIPYEWNR
jgi:hypothetical protein